MSFAHFEPVSHRQQRSSLATQEEKNDFFLAEVVKRLLKRQHHPPPPFERSRWKRNDDENTNISCNDIYPLFVRRFFRRCAWHGDGINPKLNKLHRSKTKTLRKRFRVCIYSVRCRVRASKSGNHSNLMSSVCIRFSLLDLLWLCNVMCNCKA